MKRRAISFRELLERVLPVSKLSAQDQSRVRDALEQEDDRVLEKVAFTTLDQLAHLGYLRSLPESPSGGEAVLRYRILTDGNTIAVRRPLPPRTTESFAKIPLPIRDLTDARTLDQTRMLLHMYDRLVTRESPVLRGPVEILRHVMTTARQALGCERVSFWAPRRRGEGPGPLDEIVSEPYDENLAREWVLEANYLLLVPELPAQIQPAGGAVEVSFRSVAMVPVGSPTLPVFGVLHAWSARPRHFDEGRAALLSLISEVGTDLLRMDDTLKDLVFVDAGTGVYNRSYFHLQFEKEIARTRREDASLALAIADIDDFKQVNSNYGHLAGNHVLAAVADILNTGVRPSDSVARWGGEEFAIILSSPVSESDARAVCERLRKAVELSAITVTGLEGETTTIPVTISIGGAMFPADGSTVETLFTEANKALLHAKRTGKNRVIFLSDLAGEPRA